MHNEGNYKQVKKPSEREKIIANEVADKESQKYTSSSYNSIPEKQTINQSINQKAGKRPKQTFLQGRHTDG